jgi:hypothetical protein
MFNLNVSSVFIICFILCLCCCKWYLPVLQMVPTRWDLPVAAAWVPMRSTWESKQSLGCRVPSGVRVVDV